jgi:serine/threonine-protein kinase SRPK3
VIQATGKPILEKVVTESSESPTETTTPKYLVHPVDVYKVSSRFVTDQACIIDFGESFEASNPPDDIGIPQAYRSPELVFDKVAGIGSDLWALGCTLFEIRTGRKLFGTYDDDVDDHLYCMALLLGRFPESWWTTWGPVKTRSKMKQTFRVAR